MLITFHGSIKEKTEKKEIEIFENINSIGRLKSWLKARYPDIEKYAYRIAINGNIINTEKKLKEEDRISIITPFIGG